MLTTQGSELPALLCSSTSDQISTIHQLLSRTELLIRVLVHSKSQEYKLYWYRIFTGKVRAELKSWSRLNRFRVCHKFKKKNYFVVKPLFNAFLAPYLKHPPHTAPWPKNHHQKETKQSALPTPHPTPPPQQN